MNGGRLPPGELVASRVHADAGELLEAALDRRLTGYARIEPREALLGGGDRGVLAFEEGVPILAYHPDSGAGGATAIGTLAIPGPCRAELHAVEPDRLPDPAADPELSVSPGLPAERLAGDRRLAERTRRLAPDREHTAESADSAVEAFLQDEERIEAIRERAREEATRRAEKWGFESAVE
jgi:hypothetical protein